MTGRVLTIVYLEDGMLLSKRPFSGWRDVQALHPDYKTDLPWQTPEAAAGFLASEYPDFVRETGRSWQDVVAAFLEGDDEDLVVARNDEWTGHAQV